MSIYDEVNNPISQEEPIGTPIETVEVQQTSSLFNFDFSWLKAKSPEQPVESFKEHPMNYDGKLSTARILRGATGILGELNYAVVDILMGLMEKWKEKKEGAASYDKETQNDYRNYTER